MAGTNVVVLCGRLVKDIDLRYTPGGMAVGSSTIALDRNQKKNGEWVKESHFFDFSAFGKQVEGLKPYLTKGKQINITGYLKQERWTDQNGANRSRVVVIANEIELLGGKNESSGNNGGYAQQQAAGNSYGGGYGNDEEFPEDIPFEN